MRSARFIIYILYIPTTHRSTRRCNVHTRRSTEESTMRAKECVIERISNSFVEIGVCIQHKCAYVYSKNYFVVFDHAMMICRTVKVQR